MKTSILAAMLLSLSLGIAACTSMQIQPAKPSDTDQHAGGGY
ncbi:MAG TPA: hypothetical protein VGV37_17340 [Aliidongia sp.]|nr:hypothetical protein [Aliidongia sp.]HEV2676293.1 hypothetical protein [Aliidongia sp.]